MKQILLAVLCAAGLYGQCTIKPVVKAVVDASGNSSTKGRSIEGPVCVEVYFNPLPGLVTMQTSETRTAGPDPGASLGKTGGDKGKPGQGLHADQIQDAFQAVSKEFENNRDRIDNLPASFNNAMAQQDRAITGFKTLLTVTQGVDPKTDALNNAVRGYVSSSLFNDIDAALQAQQDYQPSDNGLPSLLASLLKMQSTLLDMPIVYGASTPSWTEWYKNGNKTSYDTLKANVHDAIAAVQPYATNSDNDKALRAKAGIVSYWKGRLDSLGIKKDATFDLKPLSVVRQDVPCTGMFNFHTSIAVSLVVIDQGPTLTGAVASAKVMDPFLTVTCASRISVSAGAGFSTIRTQSFAIVKSAGDNGTVVNKFDVLSDSRFNPMPMALVHGRVYDFADHLVGLHVTFGVAGAFHGQETGGSAAEFLTGASLSIARTIYFSGGLHIGTKSQLAGGYNPGDKVPAEITTIQGQVKRSYTPGFGFAISFVTAK